MSIIQYKGSLSPVDFLVQSRYHIKLADSFVEDTAEYGIALVTISHLIL